jgi:ABC-2 type transport system permease protein
MRAGMQAMLSVRRRGDALLAIAANVPKVFLQYQSWIWMEMLVQLVWLVLLNAFWRAVYVDQAVISGLPLAVTLNYILLAQVVGALLQNETFWTVGRLVRDGTVAIELLRPVDLQLRVYVEVLASTFLTLILKTPLLLAAIFGFGVTLPADPAVWGAFFLTLLGGQAILFCMDWIFSCAAFYTTEVWGLAVLREGIVTFFAGVLLPLSMMPPALRAVVEVLPFAQALAVPVGLLSGVTPAAAAAGLLLVQAAWLVVLVPLSRFVFSRAVRRVTVQGG